MDGKGDLKPGQPITREEVASVMGRYLLDQAGTEVSSAWLQGGWNAGKTKHPFPDDSAIAPSLAPTVYYTVNQGVMEGDDGFRPRALLKRSEAAAVVNRMMDKRAGQHPLQMTGFYAIQSFQAANRMTALDQVVFGWSSLKYEGAAKGGLETRTGDYKLPDGAELAVQAADKAGLAKDLMVYAADRAKLSAFLKDAAAKESFLKELKAQLDDPRFGYTGVCIDFEDLRNGEEAPGFVRFLEELKAGLPGKSLSVAVPPAITTKGMI
ncbi:S-layer homology domain-containing protein [Paenibacillus sp. CC-CFT747]|nr:S-layer homology domain-containing protein [Paenibacillus sp. CC-CFT747]